MTNPMINPQPNYSGVTIQISNPAVYAGGGVGANREIGVGGLNSVNGIYETNGSYGQMYNSAYSNAINGVGQQGAVNPCYYAGSCYSAPGVTNPINAQGVTNPNAITNGQNIGNGGYIQNPNGGQNATQAYPPQYYLNNYNYQNNGIEGKETIEKFLNGIAKANESQNSANANGTGSDGIQSNGIIPTDVRTISSPEEYEASQKSQKAQDYDEVTGNQNKSNNDEGEFTGLKHYSTGIEDDIPQDLTKSKAVIEDLDARAAEEEAKKKNSKQKRVVALTDEYIKSLENYLNNPNDEIRLMASKEILTRLDEDKDRYDDAALNALLNKMLQDPSKLIRVAALSAFASQLASGNDYTVQLLHNIQQNPSADKEDVLQAADILLKMSAGTEIKNIPNPEVKQNPQEENKG